MILFALLSQRTFSPKALAQAVNENNIKKGSTNSNKRNKIVFPVEQTYSWLSW